MKGIEIRSEEPRLGVVDGALRVFLGGESGDREGGSWPDLVLPEVDFLKAVGGVGGGESNLGDGELGNIHFSLCFFLAAFLLLSCHKLSCPCQPPAR